MVITYDLYESTSKMFRFMNIERTAAVTTIGLVITLIGIGFFISGTPAEQRLLRMDEQRIMDLMRLTRALDDYWEEMGSLPNSASQLLDGRRLKLMPTDPSSGSSYAYEKKGTSNFTLCAAFDRPSRRQTVDNFWTHPVGEHCFSFVQGLIENK